jgi:hypothetical protein
LGGGCEGVGRGTLPSAAQYRGRLGWEGIEDGLAYPKGAVAGTICGCCPAAISAASYATRSATGQKPSKPLSAWCARGQANGTPVVPLRSISAETTRRRLNARADLKVGVHLHHGHSHGLLHGCHAQIRFNSHLRKRVRHLCEQRLAHALHGARVREISDV